MIEKDMHTRVERAFSFCPVLSRTSRFFDRGRIPFL